MENLYNSAMKKIEKNIYKIGPNSFQVKMMVSGMKISKVMDTLDDARNLRDGHKLSAALDVHETAVISSRLKKRESKNCIFGEAIEDYRKKQTKKKKGSESEGNRLDLLSRLSLAKKPLYMIGRTDILDLFGEIRTGAGQQIKGVKQRKCSESTVKRYYNLVRHIFTITVDDKKIDKNPCDLLAASERPKDGKSRDRRIKKKNGSDEETLMLAQLQGEAKVLFIMAIESSMRKGEEFSIEWPNMKFNRDGTGSVYLPDSKTDEARTVPFSKRLVRAIKELPKRKQGKVFTIGKYAYRYQFNKARKAIASPDLRAHDLRHESISRHFEKGLNVIEVASISGHKNLQTLKKYTHLSAANLAKKISS